MDKNIENNWKTINKFLAQEGANLNILEEEVDLTVQKEYFKLIAEFGREEPEKYKALSAKYIEEVNKLFDEDVDPELKKRMLVVLATVDDVAIYRSIESFSKLDTPLKKWAVIALQQSRMLIQSTLMDDPGVFISTGLGGQNGMLRYFCVFLSRTDDQLEEFQQHVIQNETECALKPLKGVIEQVEFYKGYSTLLILLPIDADLKTLFTDIIAECNLYGNFLHENMIITNVKKLSAEEISTILRKK